MQPLSHIQTQLVRLSSWLHRQPRWRVLTALGIILAANVITVLQPFFETNAYELSASEKLIPRINTKLAEKLTYDSKKSIYSFTSASKDNAMAASELGIAAELPTDISKGISVNDPVHGVTFALTPKEAHEDGKKDGNRVVYPLKNGRGWSVYTLQSTGVKEDIILTSAPSDNLTLKYDMQLGDGLESRLEPDGSIGIYGNTVLSGSVTSATEKDAKLLEKARKNAEKNTLLFTIPAPTIIEADKVKSAVAAKYHLSGNQLEVRVQGLKAANYPLSIDPTIYVASAKQFMAGNNETNVNFNVDEQLIEKGRTTGARFDTWNTTTSLPMATWNSGTAAAGGYIYTAGGTTFPGQIFNTQGASTFTVPDDVTSLNLKAWGGGGGGGGGAASGSDGGSGGGGGFIQSSVPVTPGETLSVYVGGGGNGGSYNSGGNDAGGGGGGGGYSSIFRGSTPIAIAAGGGGGGGGRNTLDGAMGGAGGGTSGQSGGSVGATGGGGGGTQSSGGTAGTGQNDGTNGASRVGGDGGDGRSREGGDGSGASGGLATGGNGGSPNINTTRAGGGGGGAGHFGGGGGAGTTSNNSQAGGGGGGGSSFAAAGSSGVVNTTGNGLNPGNAADSARNGAGIGGGGGAPFGNGASGASGLVVVAYGSGSTANASLNWAEFNTSTGSIDSANPGSGACSGWCTDSSYNLPSARSNFSLVAYSGYLYAFGGVDASGTRQNSVYIAKLGANGEPRSWHPTNSDPATWKYWHQDAAIPSIRSDMGVVAYNNRMYLVGGRSTSGPVASMHIASINPNGTLGTWSAGTSLPSAVYGHSLKVYNDRLYVIGGSSSIGGAPLSTVRFATMNADGSVNSWQTTTNLPSGRFNSGGDFATVWGAYLYVSGGCSAVNASGHCTSIRSDTQVASINADGSLDTWNTMAGVSDERTGSSLVTWRDRIYSVGGCQSQNATTGDCNSGMLNAIIYGDINKDGDASTVDQSVPSGTGSCSGTAPRECNLPGSSYIGNMLTSSFITNGHLYVVGGCTNNRCSTTSGNIAYVAISASGQTARPATCPSGTYQATIWCVNTTNSISGGLAAASPVIFNNRVYLVGGLDGGGNTNTLVRSTINDDASLSAWTTQSMTGLGMSSVSYQYATSRANPSSASIAPGNLYVFGGCTGTSGAGCLSYGQGVYKCSILSSGAISACSTSGQLQIGAIPGNTATGLAVMSGTVYANYIYLIGGITSQQQDLKTVRYAKFDNNNNIVSAGTSGWTESDKQLSVGRRRAAAFGYNGYLYVVGGYEADSGVLPDIEFTKINVGDGSLGTASEGFAVSAVKISQRWGLSVPVSNSYAYIIGGCTAGSSPDGCTTRTDVIQTFQIYNNGSGAPAGYSPSANTYTTAPNRQGASSTIMNGHIYTAGGCTNTTGNCTAVTDDVSYAPIDANGTIGTWASTTAKLPAARAWGKLRSAGSSLYYLGGQSATATDIRSEIYYATPSGGNIPSWQTSSNGLPAGRSDFGATTWDGRLYVIGGKGSGTGCVDGTCSTIYVSPKLSGGNITTGWSTSSSSFSTARSGATAVAYGNNLYLMGGHTGSTYLSDVQYSKIDSSSGNAGSWTFTTSLPGPIASGDGYAANGYLYLIGGRSADTTCSPSTIVAPISANTTIASGNNPTGVGEWFETNQRYTGARYGNSAVYHNGKAYVIGGACGSTPTYAMPAIQQTTLLAQPQVAKYSLSIDTDSDVYPAHWLLNGIDNSIGAKWQLRYRSMTNDTTTHCTNPAMTTWGQETVFGDVTLGTPGAYLPKNTSGAAMNCARYYYFNVTVDSSQAFGYPDDVTRGPTITDLTLQFTADPSKRLLHGRTFTGGIQQPIDTPLYPN